MDAPTPKPFRLVSHKEFAKLTREQKIAYLSMAIEAVKENALSLALITRLANARTVSDKRRERGRPVALRARPREREREREAATPGSSFPTKGPTYTAEWLRRALVAGGRKIV